MIFTQSLLFNEMFIFFNSKLHWCTDTSTEVFFCSLLLLAENIKPEDKLQFCHSLSYTVWNFAGKLTAYWLRYAV